MIPRSTPTYYQQTGAIRATIGASGERTVKSEVRRRSAVREREFIFP